MDSLTPARTPGPAGSPLRPRARPVPGGAAADDVDEPARAALAAGDVRTALTLVMRDHGDAVYHYCRRMVGDDLAADVHQQVFVDVYRGLPGFDGRSTLRTWIYAIARHRCIDAQRGQGRRRARDADPEGVAEVADPRPDPAASLDEVRALAALGDCIDQLAPATRSAVLLRYQEGLAYEQLAAMTGEQPGTIGRRVARALVALRDCVEGRLGRPGGSR